MSDKVTLKEKISYALVNLGNIPIQTVIGSYLLIFYTNIVGLSPASCATLFLIARVLDGLNDPFVGFAIDHIPTTKHGHFRPTLVVGTILCSLNFLLLWFGPLMATSGKLVIAYISYLLIGVLFPVMDISLNSMLPVMTTDMEERNMLSSLKGVMYMIGTLVLNMMAPIIIGNTTEKAGYIRLVIIVTIIVVVFSVVGAIGLRERVTQKPGEKKYSLKDLFKILSQRPVIITFLSSVASMTGVAVTGTMTAYFFTYVIGNLSLISVVSLVQLLAMLPASVLVGKIIGKYGKKKIYVFAMITGAFIPLIRLIDVTNIPILLVATIAAGFISGLSMPLSYGIQADNTDYVNLKMNVHAEAAVAALSSFITKCAMGIGGAIPGYMLAAVGFDAAAAKQPDGVRTVIIIGAIVIPSVLGILGTIIFAGGYPLTKEKLEAQVAEIKAVREKNV